jgi:hypothetical protein
MNHDSGFEDDLFNVEDEQKPVGTEVRHLCALFR